MVDDEAVVRAQLRRSLELRGFLVHEASDGSSGLELLDTTAMDLVIVDLTMQNLDGPDMIREMRGRRLTTPVVLTSGYIDASVEKRLERASFQAFLPKPFGIDELMRAIEQARQTTVDVSN